MKIIISETRDIKSEEIIRIYKANNWSSAEKPTELYNGLMNSHSLITAWNKEKLIGIGNAISDGPFDCLLSSFTCAPRIIKEKELDK